MDNKIIEIFEYIGEKLGIAIDWTAENVMPQVTEFMGRYQAYKIATNVALFVVGLVIIFICKLWAQKMWSDVKNANKNSIWYDSYCDEGILLTLAGIVVVILIVVSAVSCVISIFDIIEWAFVPEVKFFEVISSYLNNAS
jgi:hypothetical protein